MVAKMAIAKGHKNKTKKYIFHIINKGKEYAGLLPWGILKAGIFSINNFILTIRRYILSSTFVHKYRSLPILHMINMGKEYAGLPP
jgi:hypothetical protein